MTKPFAPKEFLYAMSASCTSWVRIPLAVFAVSVAACEVANAIPITNGGFEDPNVVFGGFAILPTIPGWTQVGGNGIEVQNHAAGDPQEGDQLVELDAFANSAMISDTFGTIVGAPYLLTFYYSDRPGVPALSNGISGSVGGIPFVVPGGTGGANTAWVKYQIPFFGTGSDQIFFAADGVSDALGGYLDNVSVASSVPDGGTTAAMLGMAMASLALIRRKLS
jgi:hypothetical protein